MEINEAFAAVPLVSCLGIWGMSQEEMDEKLLNKNVSKGKIDETRKQEITSLLIPSDNIGDATDCDIVIEAIVENMKIKSDVFANLDAICKPYIACMKAMRTVNIVRVRYFASM